MRHRSVDLLEHFKSINAPILPFLAPRAFQPSPSQPRDPLCRSHIHKNVKFRDRHTGSLILNVFAKAGPSRSGGSCNPSYSSTNYAGHSVFAPGFQKTGNFHTAKSIFQNEQEALQSSSISLQRVSSHDYTTREVEDFDNKDVSIAIRGNVGPDTTDTSSSAQTSAFGALHDSLDVPPSNTKQRALFSLAPAPTASKLQNVIELIVNKIALLEKKMVLARGKHYKKISRYLEYLIRCRRAYIRYQAELAHKSLGRTKYVRLQPSINSAQEASEVKSALQEPRMEAYSSSWTENLAMLALQYDQVFEPSGELTQLDISDGSVAKAKDLLNAHNIEKMQQRWLESPSDMRFLLWPQVLLWALQNRPENALDLLLATCVDPLPSSQFVADALDIIARHYSTYEKPRRRRLHHEYINAFHILVPRFKVSSFPASQKSIRFMLGEAQRGSVPALIERLVDLRLEFHFNTYLQMAYRCAVDGHSQVSKECLSSAASSGADTNSESFRRVCAKLLRNTADADGSHQTEMQMIEFFFSLDVQLDIAMYNVLILNATEGGDHATAWNIYDLLREHGVEPTDETYTALMASARRTDNVEALKEIVKQITDDGLNGRDQFFATELLFSTVVLQKREGLTDFEPVLHLYRQFFDTQLLHQLGMIRAPRESQAPKPQPNSRALSLMISLFIQSAPSASVVRDLYRKFHQSRLNGEPSMIELARTDHTYNAFIKWFGDERPPQEMFQVLNDMVMPYRTDTADERTGQQILPCKRTAITWSIVLNAFARNGRLKEAERVMRFMKKQGLEPTVVTWNSLLSAYVRRQHLWRRDEVANVIKRMADEEIPFDARTAKTLSRSKIRSALAKELQPLGLKNLPEGREEEYSGAKV